MRQILDPDGRLMADPPVDLATTRRLYRSMVAARLFDRKCVAMQKQGRLATYAPYEGQEAAQIGSAAAVAPDDWLVATYRDAAAMWMQGFPWESLVLWRTGDERGAAAPEGVPVLPPSITVGAHMLHAVGLAWAARLRGEDRIAITYFGDGATSEGDFHEAMNFAAVYNTGTVFLCQNNGYAISMSRKEQTKSETIAQKAEAYGVPGTVADGNDVLAVFAATTEAADRARSGGGPTLIEAVTYRAGPHTTNDDPRRYRDASEEHEWARRDPIERVRRYLEANGAWDGAWQHDIEVTETDVIEQAVAAAEALDVQEPEAMFGAMFAETTPQLSDQLAALRETR
ncbi:MAG: pyruvate dehydrogenase (acetyl-transferring) E1 component subunit alpha [Acidimicrobiia bacterium]|nr:pyruvate dehydrogenase (acetyl-transferring) E1 component subunit alpha [Acidimicrobiia bacterium]